MSSLAELRKRARKKGLGITQIKHHKYRYRIAGGNTKMYACTTKEIAYLLSKHRG